MKKEISTIGGRSAGASLRTSLEMKSSMKSHSTNTILQPKTKQYDENAGRENHEYFFIFNQWRRMEVLSTTFGLIGLLIGILCYEYDVGGAEDLVFVSDTERTKYTAMEAKRFRDPVTRLLRWVSFSSSCVAVFFLGMRNHYKVRWVNAYFNKALREKNRNQHRNMYYFYNEAMLGSKDTEATIHDMYLKERQFFNMKFTAECFLNLICPLPFFDYYITSRIINTTADSAENEFIVYNLNDFLLILMFVRLGFLHRSLNNFNLYSDAYSMKICKMYGFDGGFKFSVKVQMMTNPGFLVIYDFTTQILVLAYILRLVEYPYHSRRDQTSNNPLDHYYNSLWLIIMTITTVGYGDQFPRTELGRFIAVIASMWGAVVISLVVVTTV